MMINVFVLLDDPPYKPLCYGDWYLMIEAEMV